MVSQTYYNKALDNPVESLHWQMPVLASSSTVPLVVTSSSNTMEMTIYEPTTAAWAGKVYVQEADDSGAPTGDHFLVAEFDKDNGVKPVDDLSGNWTAWSSNKVTFELDSVPVRSTYTLESGYPEGTSEINATWKHAAVVGRTAYIGKVTQPPGGTEKGSLILKSSVGKPAGFSDKQYIDVEFGGDSIEHMVGVGDRLLVFGSNQLAVINVAQDIEFLEGTFKELGITHPRQVVPVGEGVCIVNTTGVYYFDGQQVNNLTLEKMNSVTIHTGCGVSFDGNRKLLYVWGIDNSSTTVGFYSFKTMSWVGTQSGLSIPQTNSYPGSGGKYYYEYSSVEKCTGVSYNSASSGETQYFVTGKISCGNLARNKKFYKIIITVKDCANQTLYWSTTSTDGTDNWTTAQAGLSDGVNEIKLTGATGKWIMIKMEETSANGSFSLVVSDISVVYREKTIK